MRKRCTSIREAMKHGFSRGIITLHIFIKLLMEKRKQEIYSLQDGDRNITGDEAKQF
jgi:hypothetical protein